MRSSSVTPNPHATDRLVDRVHLLGLALFLFLLSVYMSPILASWLVLVAHVSAIAVWHAWVHFLALLSDPLRHFSLFVSNLWLLFKISGVNVSFGLASMQGASLHDDFCRTEWLQARSRPRITMLLVFDTVVKSFTAVAGVLYCLLMVQTGQLYVQTPWLFVMGYGIMIQGCLGLRAKAILLCRQDRARQSTFELVSRECLEYFQHWRQRRFGRFSTHVLSDLFLITTMSYFLTPLFVFRLIWPVFYLMVAVQNAYQLFDYAIRDAALLVSRMKDIILYAQYWNGHAFVTVRRRFPAIITALSSVSFLSVCRALIGYGLLVGYVGLQPLVVVKALWSPVSLLLHYRSIVFLWRLGCLLSTFMIVPVILRLLNLITVQKEDGTLLIFPMLLSIVIKYMNAEDHVERQAKIETIYSDFMTTLVFVLFLYGVFPMLPTLSGFIPLNGLVLNMAPIAIPVLTFANTLLSAMFTKACVDLNVESVSHWLRERHTSERLCMLFERGVGLAFVAANYCRHVVIVPARIVRLLHVVVNLVFRYTGLQFVVHVFQKLGHAVGFGYVWSSMRYALNHWWFLAPVRYSYKQMSHLLSLNAMAWFMIVWLSVHGVFAVRQSWQRIPWGALQRRYQAKMDVLSETVFWCAAFVLLSALLVSTANIGLSLFSGLSWYAALSSFFFHVASVSLVGMTVYAFCYVLPEYFSWLDKSAKRYKLLGRRSHGGGANSGSASPDGAHSVPQSSNHEASAPPMSSNFFSATASAPPMSSNSFSATASAPLDPFFAGFNDDLPVATAVDPLLDSGDPTGDNRRG